MAIITWGEELSVGLKEFDDQHKQLIFHLNQLHDAMSKGQTNEIMGKILGELVNYTVYHFNNEEKVFDDFGYPYTEAHKAEHKAFTDKALELQKKFSDGKLFISVETLNFLIGWVDSHIKGSDMKYTPFLKGKV